MAAILLQVLPVRILNVSVSVREFEKSHFSRRFLSYNFRNLYQRRVYIDRYRPFPRRKTVPRSVFLRLTVSANR